MSEPSTQRLLSAEDGWTVSLESAEDMSPDEFARRVDSYLPPRGIRVVTQAQEFAKSIRVDTAESASLLRMESDLTVFAAEHLERLVGVHSAGVLIDGECVVFCGYSRAGKSTLAHEALSRGFPLLSDEYVLIDPVSGLVEGWPRPLRRREPDGSVTRTVFSPAQGAFRVGAIFSVIYRDGLSGAAPVLEEISPGEGAAELLSHVVCAQRRPEDSVKAVAAVARGARAFKGMRGEASDFMDMLPEILRS